jgi:hypothetical protein
MKKQDANMIRPLVESIKPMEALDHYVDLRMSGIKDSLVSLTDLEEIRRVQGAYQELKRFKTLRDEVNNAND